MTDAEPGAGPADATAATPTEAEPPPAWPYVLPMGGFLAMTAIEGYLPSPAWYPPAYALKVAVVSGLVWYCRPVLRDLAPRPSPGAAALAIILGLAVAAAWVGLDGRYPSLAFLGRRTAFDPSVLKPAARGAFLTVRMLGLVLLVPLVEELFYRSFLMRWVVDPDYAKVPIGRVTPAGLAATTVVFGFSHPEWLPALLTGLAWGWLLARTRSVTPCVISHATANLALGAYVLVTGDWKFW